MVVTQGQAARPLPVPATGRWRIDPSASSCSFLVRDKLVTTVRGSMPVVDGRAVLGDNPYPTDSCETGKLV